MPRKKSRFWNEEARAKLLSGLTITMMMVAAVSGMVLLSRETEASPATYVYTENFEDESPGDNISALNESWYIVDRAWSSGSFTEEVSDYNVASWTQTMKLKSPSGDTDKFKYVFNLTADGSSVTVADVEYVSVDVCQNESSLGYPDLLFKFINGTSSADALFSVGLYADNIVYLLPDESPQNVVPVSIGTWYNLNVTFNYTDHKVKFVVAHGATEDYSGWHNMTNNYDGFNQIRFEGSGGYETATTYHDNLTVGSNTKLYTVSGSSNPGEPTSVTAQNYAVNFTASGSISGFDTNTRLTFPQASVNASNGDTVWSNATSYGTITLTNDGINQINISWTKGTGATNTIVEVDTSDHSPWNVGTGMEIYNDTGTSTVFDYNDNGTVTFEAETTYYFALFSYNASGYSSAATTSAITDNISIDTINIHIEDIGSGDNLVPRENLTVYEAGSTTGGWAFDAATGNISITTANGLPLAPGDADIQFVIKGNVPPGIADGTYYDAGMTSLECSITIEHTA